MWEKEFLNGFIIDLVRELFFFGENDTRFASRNRRRSVYICACADWNVYVLFQT
jgi:hypothetical protein